MENTELLPHLFRTEYRKIIAVLCKVLGVDNIEKAEDVVAETFLIAAETWGQKGIPQNPSAWLYAVSKNKALDLLKRHKLFTEKISPALHVFANSIEPDEIDLSNENIIDSQLQMMFAVCHPSISTEAQIGLSLNILCGFGAEEIADAFLTSRETIYKRLARAKEKLKAEKVKIELPLPDEMERRLETVLKTLYLLFSEGYYSTSQNSALRKDLCLEAMRLNFMLIENDHTNSPAANALLSLMCFHSSRFEARTNANGELILYEDQDENLWNQQLIERGTFYLNRASCGKSLSKYHLEAAIAYWHTQKHDAPEKWESILQLYNRLLQIEYSPIAALNRTYALAKANGVGEALIEAEKLQLTSNHFYFALLGELYKTVNKEKAKNAFLKAWSLAKTVSDKQIIQYKIDQLE